MGDEIIGSAEHYAQFVKLCRARIEALGLTYDSVDALCGFSSRYTAKLLCECKVMSIYSFFTLARALALTPEFRHDGEQLAQLQRRGDWIAIRRTGERFRGKSSSGIIRFQNHIDFYRQIGRKGAIAMHAKRIRRKEAARIAARIGPSLQ
jgi:hypothetical protein